MSPSVELPELDPFAEDFQQFPFATLALLRERAPVHAMAEPGWYIVTTIELVREVLTDWQIHSLWFTVGYCIVGRPKGQ